MPVPFFEITKESYGGSPEVTLQNYREKYISDQITPGTQTYIKKISGSGQVGHCAYCPIKS